jgi:hypothetical protein
MSEIATVRLLVGTRRELLTSLGTTFTTLDLDMPAYRADEDVAGYVRQVLLAADEPEIITPYRGKVELAQHIGEGVARRASGVFLVARMTAPQPPQRAIGGHERARLGRTAAKRDRCCLRRLPRSLWP